MSERTFGEYLLEASLSRVWQHFKSNNTVILFTAFRGDVIREVNLRNNKFIASELRLAGFGYFYVDGYWIENKGKSDERHVSEDSIFAIADAKGSEKLIDLAHKLANKFNQDAILVKDSNDKSYFLEKNGSRIPMLGKLYPGRLGDVYTKLRNNKKANTFVFEAERVDDGFINKLMEQNEKLH